jgi:flagellar hook protein FlgE
MGLYGVLNSGVSGMNAQTNRLGTVADNIQNQNTTGYKRSSTEFSSFLIDPNPGSYNSGSVDTVVRHAISSQGTRSATTSATDVAINGSGFFVVKDSSGKIFLTRAGNFLMDASTKDLVNAAGMHLMGYNLASGDPKVALNSYDGLVPVNLASLSMQARPSTSGTISGNFPADAPVVTGGANYTKANSVTTYDNLGHAVLVDLYFSKTGASSWEVQAFDRSNPGSFPGSPLGTKVLNFDSSGQVTGAPTLNFTVPNGQAISFDLSNTTALAGDYTVRGDANGTAPSSVTGSEIGEDGTVYAIFEDNKKVAAYRIPLATVASPDNLNPRAGNVFDTTPGSGTPQLGFATTGGRGTILSKMLEESNVDLGTELATMIQAQTSFGADSKVFQTGNEMLELLVNLKR